MPGSPPAAVRPQRSAGNRSLQAHSVDGPSSMRQIKSSRPFPPRRSRRATGVSVGDRHAHEENGSPLAEVRKKVRHNWTNRIAKIAGISSKSTIHPGWPRRGNKCIDYFQNQQFTLAWRGGGNKCIGYLTTDKKTAPFQMKASTMTQSEIGLHRLCRRQNIVLTKVVERRRRRQSLWFFDRLSPPRPRRRRRRR